VLQDSQYDFAIPSGAQATRVKLSLEVSSFQADIFIEKVIKVLGWEGIQSTA